MNDKLSDKNVDGFPALRIETHKSGIFRFSVGVDMQEIQPLMDRVNDAQDRFSKVPTLPDIATQIEKEVLVSSIYGTNTIEGGTLTEQETEDIVSGNKEIKEEKQKRVANIKAAYTKAEWFANTVYESGSSFVKLEEIMLTDLHSIITGGLKKDEPKNIPSQYRDNKPGETTRVGTKEHGGEYLPPKCKDDIVMLVKEFLEWINSDPICALSPLIRAPLIHYYFERIHPFWDGNGRVGRVLEALVLKSSGFKYAPFAMSRYYLENIDEYFSVFNLSRKAEEKKEIYPNSAFIKFFLEGMLKVINRLHDRVNAIVAFLLYETALAHSLNTKKINNRQYTIVNNLIPYGTTHDLDEVRAKLWFENMYKKLTERTQYRDIKNLVDLDFIDISPDKKIKLKIEGF